MPAITIRNLSDETHRALKIRAAKCGTSSEAYVRELLTETLKPKEKLGDALVKIARAYGTVELDITRDPEPVRAADFE